MRATSAIGLKEQTFRNGVVSPHPTRILYEQLTHKGHRSVISRLNYLEINSRATNGLAAINKHVSSIDDKLRALVELRVSQINGCVYCLDVHAEQARAHGETQQRLDCLAAWHEYPFFNEAERAALAWADAVTLLPDSHASDDVYDNLRQHFSDQEVVDLTLVISLMNAWNRLAVSFRHLPDVR